MADHSKSQDNPHGQGFIGHAPPMFLVANFLALIVLMVLTIWFSYIDLGHLIVNNVVAMTIAIIKMVLVISIFMGVKYGTRLIKVWAAAGFVWFLLLFLMFGDYYTRNWEVVPGWDPDKVDYPVLGSGPGGGNDEAGAAH